MNSCAKPGCVNQTNTKYCSRSCANAVNNQLHPKRQLDKCDLVCSNYHGETHEGIL